MCYPIPHHSEFPDEEYYSYWYIQKDTDECINHSWDVIEAFENAKALNHESKFPFCIRGLEKYIMERAQDKQLHRIVRENAYLAVLVWGRGLNEEEIARRYQTVSKECVARAIKWGRKDAAVARKILQEETASENIPERRRMRSCSSSSSPVTQRRRKERRRKASDAPVR